MESLLVIFCLLPMALSEVRLLKLQEEITTIPPPPRPYAFGYAAGRYNGHIDRTHSEVSDGSGLVQGSYSYVDPLYKIRTVEYTADKYGFHPVLNQQVPDLPSDTPVVAAAKENHLRTFAAIADSRQAAPGVVVLPVDTKAVQYAKNKHFSLYQQIAEEHARMAAELEALKKNQAPTVVNSLEHDY